MQLGMIFGIFWCISFLFLVSGDVTLTSISSPLILITPLIGFFLARKFKRNVQKDGPVSWGRAYLFSLLMYFYATAILSLVSLIYFKYFDNGRFVQHNIEILNRPEIKQLFENPEFLQSFKGISLEDLKTSLLALTPATIASSILNMNVLLAFGLSLPTAFFAQTHNQNISYNS